jgi:hypothetical protein
MARLYGTAALLMIGIVPWTILAMNETNRKLTAKAQEKVGMKGSGVRDEDVHGLLRKWTTLNGIRSVLPLLGSVVAMVAVWRRDWGGGDWEWIMFHSGVKG